MDPVEAVAGLLESLSAATASPAPGDLHADEPTIRVFVEDREDVPPGHVAYRSGPLYYYEEPLVPEEMESMTPPADPFDITIYEKADGDPGSWVPYEGPRGGEGWRNTATGEIVYQEEPPGETPDVRELVEIMEQAGVGDAGEVEDLLGRIDEARAQYEGLDTEEMFELADYVPNEGDVVRVAAPDGMLVEGEVVLNDGDWLVVDDGRGELEFELEDVDVELVEEREPVHAWSGEKHPDPVEVDAGDVAEALEVMGVEDDTAWWSAWRGRPTGNSPREVLESAANEIPGIRRMDVNHAIRIASREKRFADNNAPEHLDPTRAEKMLELHESGSQSGITAEAMDVAVMGDGSRVYLTHVDTGQRAGAAHQPVSGARDAEVAVSAASALEAMGVEVPDHHYEHNRFLAVEGTGGWLANRNRYRHSNVDPGQAQRAVAAQVLIGNRDPHAGNMSVVLDRDEPMPEAEVEEGVWVDMGEGHYAFVESVDREAGGEERVWYETEAGRNGNTPKSELEGKVLDVRHKLVPFDLDLSGKDATGWMDDVHAHSGAGDVVLRKAAKTYKAAVGDDAPVDVVAEEIAHAATDLADSLDADEVVEVIPDREMRETVRKNIEAWQI